MFSAVYLTEVVRPPVLCTMGSSLGRSRLVGSLAFLEVQFLNACPSVESEIQPVFDLLFLYLYWARLRNSRTTSSRKFS